MLGWKIQCDPEPLIGHANQSTPGSSKRGLPCLSYACLHWIPVWPLPRVNPTPSPPLFSNFDSFVADRTSLTVNMPPKIGKHTKAGALNKEQVAERVKEIQMRQKNWLRQRDYHINNGYESSSDQIHVSSSTAQPAKTIPKDAYKATPKGSGTGGADILKIHHKSSQDVSSQVSDKLNVKVKHGFGAWLQSRKTAEDTEQNEVNGTHHGEEEAIEHSNARELSEEHSTLSTTSHKTSNRSYPLTPAEFDTLADSIASRVKQDLGIRNGQADSTGRNPERREIGGESLPRGKTFVQDETDAVRNSIKMNSNGGGDDGDENGAVDVSSHRCAFCSSLMAMAQHAPTLLVPCGHTVCKVCATSHNNCRLCGTKVASLTTNIMLQQIINEFNRKKGGQASHHSRVDATWEGLEEVHAASLPKTTAIQREVNYTSQLQNLHDRQSALEEEANSRRREKDRVTNKVKRAEQQLNAILREESGMMEQLRQMEEKLRDLRHHKEEYSGEVRQLQEDQRTASEQVTQVERTVKSLGEEIDKENDLYHKHAHPNLGAVPC
ncbi:uncharacterized protein [Littorina saxatilis]|uniref:uncharacterized protein isoform X3 n=1 Tax=Littorina saxatilis TaxID=31220 RepID=UPI0038B61E10